MKALLDFCAESHHDTSHLDIPTWHECSIILKSHVGVHLGKRFVNWNYVRHKNATVIDICLGATHVCGWAAEAEELHFSTPLAVLFFPLTSSGCVDYIRGRDDSSLPFDVSASPLQVLCGSRSSPYFTDGLRCAVLTLKPRTHSLVTVPTVSFGD